MSRSGLPATPPTGTPRQLSWERTLPDGRRYVWTSGGRKVLIWAPPDGPAPTTGGLIGTVTAGACGYAVVLTDRTFPDRPAGAPTGHAYGDLDAAVTVLLELATQAGLELNLTP